MNLIISAALGMGACHDLIILALNWCASYRREHTALFDHADFPGLLNAISRAHETPFRFADRGFAFQVPCIHPFQQNPKQIP